MSEKEHHRRVLEHFKELFLGSVNDLVGLQLNVEKQEIVDEKAFVFNDQMVSFLDLHGSVFGYLAIICKETSAGALLDMPEDSMDESSREMIGPFFMELLNTVSGKIVNTIVEQHPIVTITTPRLLYGSISMSQASSSSIVLETERGTFELFYATDSMGLKVIELLDKVKAQNSQLEEAQKEIRLILDNINSGLITIDMENVVGSESSKVAEMIFGKDIGGKCASQVLFHDEKTQKEWESFYKLVQNHALPFDELERLAPDSTRFTIDETDLVLNYKFVPIYEDDTNKKVIKVMVMAKDVTYEEQLKEEAKEREERAEFIHKVIVNKDNYLSFLNEMFQCIDNLESVSTAINEEEILEAFRSSHTIKGNASIYRMTKMRNAANDFEDLLMKARDKEVKVDDEFKKTYQDYCKLILGIFDEHVNSAEDMFGEIFDPRKNAEKNYTIQESALNELIQMTDNPSMLNKLERIKLKRIRIFLSNYPSLVKTLAEKLEKQVHPLKVTGEDTLIDPNRWSSFFAAFVHLIRNCVDHGIETLDERFDTDKDEYASISIDVHEEEKGVTIIVSDDGRGINPEFVAKKAMENEVVTEEDVKKMSNEEKQLLIFKPGFSTRDSVSCTSGRGIGMDAVFSEVEKLYGKIEVESAVGKGTKIKIFVPYIDNETVFSPKLRDNQRQFERKSLPIYAEVRSEKGEKLGYIVDISIDGFRLTSQGVDFEIGDTHELNIEISMEEDYPEFIWLKMEVMNVKKNLNGVFGWGCKIVSFENEADRMLYEKYLRSLFR